MLAAHGYNAVRRSVAVRGVYAARTFVTSSVSRDAGADQPTSTPNPAQSPAQSATPSITEKQKQFAKYIDLLHSNVKKDRSAQLSQSGASRFGAAASSASSSAAAAPSATDASASSDPAQSGVLGLRKTSIEHYQRMFTTNEPHYSHNDLNEFNHARYRVKKRKSLKPDIFHAFDINPLHEYKYVSLLSQYVTDMGRIISREKTGLTKINQRRVSKAIRRARAFGLMPVTYKSPVMFEPNKKLNYVLGMDTPVSKRR